MLCPLLFQADASDGSASRRYRFSFAPPFHARSILRRESSPYPRNPVTEAQKGLSIHWQRDYPITRKTSEGLLLTARVSAPVARTLPKLISQYSKIDRSIDRSIGGFLTHTYTYTHTHTVLAFRRCFPFSRFFSLSQSRLGCDVATLTIRATNSERRMCTRKARGEVPEEPSLEITARPRSFPPQPLVG